MSRKMRPTRFAHLEGHTDICYSEDGRLLITCGLDGDIRIFKGLDDDDCITHTIAEQVHCVAFNNKCIIAGTNLNIVQSYTLDEGKANGIITRCTSFPTHISISKDKKLIAVASSDMTIKVHDLENYQDLIFSGHEAPVLSVALDPKRDFLATSSCDGTVCVWNCYTQTLVRSFPLLPKCNDFNFSTTLCRLCWSLDGQYLFVPVNSEIQVFNRNTWKVQYTLKHSSIIQPTSVATISSCGQYIAAGCRDGRIVVWHIEEQSCVISEKSAKGMAITGLVWHPHGKEELAFVNQGGEFGTMENFLKVPDAITTNQIMQEEKMTRKPEHENVSIVFPPLDLDDDDNDEDDSEISIAKIKSQLGFADDEEGTFLGVPKLEGDDNMSRPLSRIETPIPAPTVVAPKLPDPQKPFQIGMTPEHLTDRYMLWNNSGIVRQYQSEDEQSIEVEFHDHTVHHALHLNNHLGHSMAALNNEALALAAENQYEQFSKLVVHHFSAWDGSKEWQIEMVEGEDILAIGIGIGWVAVATDLRNLRIFTVTGVQKDLLSIPGPVVCLAGFEKNIMIVFHSGIGVCGEQSMSALVLSISSRRHLISTPLPISLSPKSFLAWAGFTDEGTPMTVDSVGVVRLFNKTVGQGWTPILNTKSHAKGKSDHYFILGASEVQGHVRCILCKESRYPPVLPRPHVSLLNFKIPLCEPESEKSDLEEKMIWSKLLSCTLDSLAKDGFDMDAPQHETSTALKEAMVKLFALACRADRESRGVDICELMPSVEMVEVAIKYASKLRRLHLAEKLNNVIQCKVEENDIVENGNFDMEGPYCHGSRRQEEESVINEEMTVSDASLQLDKANPESREVKKSNPLLAVASKQTSKDRFIPSRSVINPFKKPLTSASSVRGMQVLDTLKLARKKEDTLSPVMKPVLKKPRGKQSNLSTLRKVTAPSLHKAEKENKTDNIVCEVEPVNPAAPTATPPLPKKKASALKLWLEDNREMLTEKFPIVSETELLVKAALIFKDEEDSVKQKYKAMASTVSQTGLEDVMQPATSPIESEEKKRKSNLYAANQPLEKKIKSTGSKLADFAFSKGSS